MKSLLLGVIADVIRDELADPRLGIFSLTEIELSRDLSNASIKVATVGGPEASAQTCTVLNHAAPLLWNRIRHETDLRTVPKVRFYPDTSGEHSDRIFQLLEELGPLPEQADLQAEAETDTDSEADSEPQSVSRLQLAGRQGQ